VEIRCPELTAVRSPINRRPVPLAPETPGDCVAAGNPGFPVRVYGLVRDFRHIRIGISVSTQKSVPKIIDDGKIAIGMFMMNKMELLLSPEPSKS
jgi:hypothetical protein